MGYLHIDNLYRNADILMFRECYALEKIHGTSAHIDWDSNENHHSRKDCVAYFSGGENHSNFEKLFDREFLYSKFKELGYFTCTIYGEAYGGKQQGMSDTYGKELKFIVFDVKIGDRWLDVPRAEMVAKELGLEFVSYERCSTDVVELNRQRDLPSVQAVRNGVTEPKKREGVVLRPIIELVKNNESRIISKHKTEDFRETKTPRPDVNPEQLKVLADADAVAEEWVTPMRLQHIVGGLQCVGMEDTPTIMKMMNEDIQREGDKEIVWSKEVSKAISKKTAKMFKDYLKSRFLSA